LCSRLPLFAQSAIFAFALGRQRLVVLDGRELFSILPPSTMSVPRPAMLVAMVTIPGGRPAHDFRLTRMLLGVQHLMRQLFLVEQAGQQFGGFDRGRADQHRLTTLMGNP
jgi:hypothetical protein